MKSIILCLLVTSCAHQGREYTISKSYREVGTKCADRYYFHYEMQKCVAYQTKPIVYSPTGITTDRVTTYQSSPQRRISLNLPEKTKTKVIYRTKKESCQNVYKHANKCSLER